MNDGTCWQIPPSTLHWLRSVPSDRPVAMLLRHSARDQLPPGPAGNGVPINRSGVELAHALESGRITAVLRRLETLAARAHRNAILMDGRAAIK